MVPVTNVLSQYRWGAAAGTSSLAQLKLPQDQQQGCARTQGVSAGPAPAIEFLPCAKLLKTSDLRG